MRRHVVRPSQHSKRIIESSSVWISDRLLQDTFEAFASRRRRLANIPGPLEARKRAARRRLTNTRRVDCGYDLLFNDTVCDRTLAADEQSRRWWNSTEATLQVTWRRPRFNWRIWEWWSQPTPPINHGALAEALTMDQDVLPLIDKPNSVYRDCASILNLIDERSIRLTHDPGLASRILAAALKHQWQQNEVYNFLTEPRLNPTGSQNYAYFVAHAKDSRQLLSGKDMTATILHAARLGLISVAEVSHILSLAPSTTFGERVGAAAWPGFCRDLVRAMQQSKVFKIRDLGSALLDEWPKRNDIHVDAATLDLMWTFQKVQHKYDAEDLALLLGRILKLPAANSEEARLHIAQMLSPLPAKLVTRTFFLLAQMLMQRLSARTTSPSDLVGNASTLSEDHIAEHLESGTAASGRSSLEDIKSEATLWYEVLVQFREQSEVFNLSKAAFDSWIYKPTRRGKGFQVPELRNQARARFTGAIWTAAALLNNEPNPSAQITSQDFETATQAVYLEASQASQSDILSLVLDDVAASGLPVPAHFLAKLTTLTGGYVTTTARYTNLSERLEELRRQDLDTYADGNKFTTSLRHFPQTLQTCSELVNQDLGRFREVAIAAIAELPGMDRSIVRMLQCNLGLKTALAWNKSQPPTNGAASAMSWVSEERDSLGGNTTAQVLDMIDSIAWACALTNHSSDRTSWDQVYSLYQFEGPGLCTVQMRRALWYVAAVRPLYPSLTRTKWVFGVIEQHEGRALAEHLVRVTHRLLKNEVSRSPRPSLRLKQESKCHIADWLKTSATISTDHC